MSTTNGVMSRFEALVMKRAENRVGRYGNYLFLQCRNPKDNENFGVISKTGDSKLLCLEPGQLITVWKDGNKYRLFDSATSPRNNGGSGFKAVGEVIQNSSNKSKPFEVGNFGYISEKSIDEEYEEEEFEELELPNLLSVESKKKLAQLTKERAGLLRFSIDTIRDELKDSGYEFSETTIKSLGVTLFIHIARLLP